MPGGGAPGVRRATSRGACGALNQDSASVNSIMLFRLNVADPAPLHEQLTGSIRRAIAEGELAPGDRVPPAKELAAQLDVNANTVLRALRELRDEGVLEFRRGRGIRVSDTADVHAVLHQQARDLIAEAARFGYSRADLIALIERID